MVFDIAFVLFLVARLQLGSVKDQNKPKYIFAYPSMDGKTEYEEHVRFRDSLAALCANIKLPSIEFTNTKFEKIFGNAISILLTTLFSKSSAIQKKSRPSA